MVIGRDDLGHAFEIGRFLRKIELALQRLRELPEHALDVDDLLKRRARGGFRHEGLEQREVLLDLAARVRPLHLHDDAITADERRAMHLADGAGGQSLRLDRVEDVLPGNAELLLHDRDDLGLAHRRHFVLQRGELRDELRRQEIGARREDLPELGESGPELLERGAQALGLPLPARGAVRVGLVEELLQPMLGGDSGDARAARRKLRMRRLFLHGAGREPRRGVLARRVHDDHRAARIVADSIGHVAEQELLASGHAEIADDEHVDGLLLRSRDDGVRGVGVDEDQRAAARASEALRIGGKLGAGGVGARVIAGARRGGVRVLRDDDLHDEELGAVEIGEERRPARGAVGGLGPIHANHHAAHGRVANERRRRRANSGLFGEARIQSFHSKISRDYRELTVPGQAKSAPAPRIERQKPDARPSPSRRLNKRAAAGRLCLQLQRGTRRDA